MLLVLFLSSLLATSCLSLKDSCQNLNEEFEDFHIDLLETSVVRFVSLHENSTDSPPCLCRANPCSSPRYALYGDPEAIFPVDNITIVLGSGIHRLNEGLTLINSSFISFIGVEGTVLQCGRDPIFDNCSLGNVFISDSSYVSFSDITFQNCHDSVPMVHVKWSDHVIFNRCTFQNNPMSAVHLQQVDSVAFRECNFIDNIHVDTTLTFDNHTSHCYLQQTLSNSFFFNTGPTAGAISLYADNQPFKLLVSGSTFNGNSASGDHSDDLDVPNTLLQHGHGGAMYIRLVDTSNAEICIENSNFTANSAEVNGGAFQFSAAERSNENKITIIKSNFIDNNCTSDSCTGGAISIDYFQDSVSNSFIIIDSLFMDNRAGAGGAVVLLTSVNSVSHEFSEHLVIRGCRFIHNFAIQDGSALSIFSVTPISSFPLPLAIQDCLFHNNTALNTNQKTAAVSGFRVDISFLGTNVFHNNFGGGLSVIESQVNVQNKLVFHHNFATSGGALALYGRCLLKLYEGSNLTFYENFALRNGGGLYVEYVRTDFIFGILNRGCFIQYQSIMDLPPRLWNTTVNFISNTAGEAGAAIYASDMSYCKWYGDDISTDTPIFVPYQDYKTPFYFRGNRIGLSDFGDNKSALSTDAFQMTVETEEDYDSYSYNEGVSFRLSALDRFNNPREAVWQVDAPLENEPLGAISSERTLYTYRIPSMRDLMETNENSTNISLTFSIFTISTSITPVERNISVDPCHPGYTFDRRTTSCQCDFNLREIVRCDGNNRYFYVQEGLWVYTNGSEIVFRGAIPGFLDCKQEGNLPGCLFKFDEPNEQCATGRTGDLCAHCTEGYNLALDLLRCSNNCSNIGAAFLFVGVCILTVIATFLALYFDVALPNELKGFIFFAQVIGVIYRNSPYLNRNEGAGDQFLDFIINMFGLSLPFPVCFTGFSGAGITWLGVVPPILALATALIYLKSAENVKFLYERKSYGFHGFHFICLFIYKYFLDTSFAFVSIRRVYGNHYVFSYTGESFLSPLILTMFIIGIVSVFLFAVVIPIIFLVYIYRPQKRLHLANAFTFGLKTERIYLWHGVWDIWRRLPFVAINLFISVSTVSILVLLHCLMVLVVLTVHCVFKPYKKESINFIEVAILFCLLGATLAILDEDDIYIGRRTGIFFITIPFVYALVIFIYYIIVKLYRRKNPDFSLSALLASKVQKFSPLHKSDDPSSGEEKPKEPTDATTLSKSEQFDASGSIPLREPLLDL